MYWKGGRSRELWRARGRPANPGRLNDLLHIVYRAAGETHPPERAVYHSMLRPDLLKENIDGEAVEWAEARLLSRPETRKLLIAISDGAPVDDSTLEENPTDCLVEHLRSVIRRIEFEEDIEATSIGLGDLPYNCSFSVCGSTEKVEDFGLLLLRSIENILLQRRCGRAAA